MVSLIAQFDVYPNPNPSARHGMPYVVVAQSDLLETLPTRSLRKALANVSAQAGALIAAMDVVLSGV